MARPSAKKIIKDNLDRIEKWVAAGLSMKEVAKNLGISERTLYKYKAEDPQFMQTVKKARQVCVEILENTMFKSATGFTQTVKKYEKVKRCTYKDGKKLKEWEEIIEVEVEEYFKPDITAGIFLLKNWGNYVNEPRVLEIRQKELELQKQKLEASEW
jgi:transposase